MRDIGLTQGRGRVDSWPEFPDSEPADIRSFWLRPEKDPFQDTTSACEGPTPRAPRDFLDKEIHGGKIHARCSQGWR